MHLIPDTGSGLAGFLAHWLWQLYAYFPSFGRWDWVLLFLCVSFGSLLVFLPYLWKSVEADMAILKEARVTVESSSNQRVWIGLWQGGWMFFFLWFFQTFAGRTFLADRGLSSLAQATNVHRGLFWASLAIVLFWVVVLVEADEKMDTKNKASGLTASRPFPRRDLASLYAGGGVFVSLSDNSPQVEQVGNITTISVVVIFCAHLFYWYWSVASLVLMHCFLASALVADGIRMLFVYILHQRTFR